LGPAREAIFAHPQIREFGLSEGGYTAPRWIDHSGSFFRNHLLKTSKALPSLPCVWIEEIKSENDATAAIVHCSNTFALTAEHSGSMAQGSTSIRQHVASCDAAQLLESSRSLHACPMSQLRTKPTLAVVVSSNDSHPLRTFIHVVVIGA